MNFLIVEPSPLFILYFKYYNFAMLSYTDKVRKVWHIPEKKFSIVAEMKLVINKRWKTKTDER